MSLRCWICESPTSLDNPFYKCGLRQGSEHSPDCTAPYTLSSGKLHWQYQYTTHCLYFSHKVEERTRPQTLCGPDPTEYQFRYECSASTADTVSAHLRYRLSTPELIQLLSGKSMIRYFPQKQQQVLLHLQSKPPVLTLAPSK